MSKTAKDKGEIVEKISFIIPCYRSETTVESVIDEIMEKIETIGRYEMEIIAVNDASPDNVLEVLKKRALSDSRIKVLSLAKNFGQQGGMMAGLSAAAGDILVFLDDDGQCPVNHLEELLFPIEHGYDVSIAEYKKKKQSRFKNFGHDVYTATTNLMLDKPKAIQLSNFVAMRRYVADEMKLYKGPYPELSGLYLRTCGRIVNVPMEDRERLDGGSTYTFAKLFGIWMSGFTSFSIKPLRFATIAGTMISLLGFIYGIYVIISRLHDSMPVEGWSSTMSVLLFLGGMILFVMGIVGEYVGRIYMSINNTPQYVIRETVNLDSDSPLFKGDS